MTTATTYLGDFRIIRPTYSANHDDSVEWLSRAHAKAESVVRKADPAFDPEAFRRSMDRHVRRFGCPEGSLAARGHDLSDFLHLDWERMRVFNLDQHPSGAGMDVRMEVFAEIADRMAEAFYPAGEEPPRDIIHVTCTGYVAPSAAQKLVVGRGWQERTGTTHAYHMGCYASMPAVRIAAGYLALAAGRTGPEAGRMDNPSAGRVDDPPAGRVDILHSEICTLHLDPARHLPEQLVVQSLFADGHIRYSVSGARGKGPSLAYLGCREALIPGSLGAMGWILGDKGMRMILAREVPELISAAVKDFLRGLFESTGVAAAEALGRGLFAVHPGGPRIIDKVASLLELAPAQVQASRDVLRECGNMSSATLPHIWARIAADPAVAPGTLVTSLAFGPGLTVYGAMLRKA